MRIWTDRVQQTEAARMSARTIPDTHRSCQRLLRVAMNAFFRDRGWRGRARLSYSAANRMSARVLTLLPACLLAAGCMQETSEPTRSIAPYGTWASPLTAARVTAGALRFDDIVLDGDDVYWIEGRASEGGRNVIVRRTADGRTLDVTPGRFNVRSRVHEYGGAATAVHKGDVFFANFSDQRLYRQRGGGDPVPLTPSGYFYADVPVDRARAGCWPCAKIIGRLMPSR